MTSSDGGMQPSQFSSSGNRDSSSEDRDGPSGNRDSFRSRPDVNSYQLHCPRQGCKFVTIRSPDPLALPGIVAELNLHIQDSHGATRDKDSFRGDKEREAFIRATQAQDVPAGSDDRNQVLHSLRFVPGVLDVREAASKSPIVQKEDYMQSDWSHLGMEILNDKAWKCLLDRGDKNKKLEWFSPQNIGVTFDTLAKIQSLKEGKWQEGRAFKDIRDAGEALRAYYIYKILHLFYHQQDYGPEAMFHVALNQFLGGCKLVQPFLDFFHRAVSDNAGR